MFDDAPMDDAVTAYHNGKILETIGFSPEFVHGYRKGYDFGMTWGIAATPRFRRMFDNADHQSSHHAGLIMGLDDAEADRKSRGNLQSLTFVA